MSEYKAVRITGGAVADLSGGKRTRKRKVKGGDQDQDPSVPPSVPSIPLESFKNAIITKVGTAAGTLTGTTTDTTAGTTKGGAAALMQVPPPTAPVLFPAPSLTSLKMQPQQMQPMQI
jgi:hypothetical protein